MDYEQRRRALIRERRRRRRRRAFIIKTLLLIVLLAALVMIALYVTGAFKFDSLFGKKGADKEDNSVSEETEESSQEDLQSEDEAIISQAEAIAVQYDYDGAIELLKSIDNYDQNSKAASLIEEYEAQNASLVEWEPTSVTHIFFHSLVVDPTRAFSIIGSSGWDSGTAGFCEWMTTIDEFDAMMEQMYERGYVLVSINDLIDRTTDEDGTVHISAKSIYLPENKIPFVLSVDDLSYYHSYDDRGIATKMIVGEDGTPTCEYVDADGNTLVGSYDTVPRLDDFIEEHPDFSYKNAKGTIALTGYNGILGYRTDFTYRDRVDLDADQKVWLDENPDFDWDAEVAAAKEVADCIKEDGWTFASHTWGHIRIGDASLSWIQTDTGKWLDYVKPIVGETDIIIFAHGQDLAGYDDDYASSEKFQYLKSVGFNVFCNVDSQRYFVQIGDLYLRMGRRNLDGYRLYEAIYGGTDRLSDLFDAATVIDALRPTDAYLYEN